MFMAFTIAAGVIARLVMKRRAEGGRIHPTLLTMLAALGMHWVFLTVHTLHLRTFVGAFAFHFCGVFVWNDREIFKLLVDSSFEAERIRSVARDEHCQDWCRSLSKSFMSCLVIRSLFVVHVQ